MDDLHAEVMDALEAVVERCAEGAVIKTPITYWGGKQQLSSTILKMAPAHKVYDEPFFGGGAVFFAKRAAEVEFVNDINKEMVNFYRCIKSRNAELVEAIDKIAYSEAEQRHARFIYTHSDEFGEVERAAAVFVLSHQSVLSILDNTWSISKGANSAARWDKIKRDNLTACERRMQRTQIFCRDALGVIKAVDGKDTFHYCDPPYYNSDCGHYAGYGEGNFVDLLEVLEGVQGRFLLSSYPSKALEDYTAKNGWRSVRIEMIKSASTQGNKKVEMLTYNYDADRCKDMTLFDV